MQCAVLDGVFWQNRWLLQAQVGFLPSFSRSFAQTAHRRLAKPCCEAEPAIVLLAPFRFELVFASIVLVGLNGKTDLEHARLSQSHQFKGRADQVNIRPRLTAKTSNNAARILFVV